MLKKISPASINALKEALCTVYWYKSDLKSFLMSSLSDPAILTKINWDTYKINIVSSLISFLVLNEEQYQKDILYLMAEVVKIKDYTHLQKLEDGDAKAKKARHAVEALEKLVEGHLELTKEMEELETKRQDARSKLLHVQELNKRLEMIKNEYYVLISAEPHLRGYKLESILKDLFELFDLDPKASFKIVGEQIDGAFSFEGTDYLFEAKWQNELISISDLDSFQGKLMRKLDNTLGVYCSINGYSDDAVKAHSIGRKLVILMDGADLMAVLEGRFDLIELLLRKRRYASQTGNIYLRMHELMKNLDK